MKRRLMICLITLLACGPAAFADEYHQDQSNRPRTVTLPSSSFLGVDLADVTGEAAGRLRLREERGALVTDVTTDTAASKAGLQKDDVIVKWNGEAIESARELGRHIRETPAGRTVKLGVVRGGREMEVTVTLGDRGDYLSRFKFDASQARTRIRPVRVNGRSYRMGISLQSMSPQLAEYFGLKDRNGALVVFVHPDTGAAKAGIKAGDVILSVGGEAVDNPLKIHQILRSKSEGPVEVKVMRDKQERTFTVQLEKSNPSSIFISPDDLDDVVDVVVEVPRIVIAPMPPIAIPAVPSVPSVRIAPIHITPVKIAPIHIAPVAIPRIRIAPISPPKISIPPLKLIMPRLVFTNPV
ncbi:MAG TPA: PDZ domain-containing protein [Blastocatellia bacterium]|nr:PDZ domain-containing protein [Blastocatellia bacterium]